MKAVISSTYDDKYLFYLPIVTWCWNKLNVDVICFMPNYNMFQPPNSTILKIQLLKKVIEEQNCKIQLEGFYAPEHKEATYAQLSRLFISGVDGISDDEIFCTSDVDMMNFKIPPYIEGYDFTVWGSDLTEKTQYPVCYVAASKSNWTKYLNLSKRSVQQALDHHLGHIECESFRGNYWCFEQEFLFKRLQFANCNLIPRSNGQNQFAQNRIDRDDAYFMERLTPDIIDYHCHRPGYTDENFEKILSVIQYFYPNDDLNWMRTYQQQYKQLL